MPALAGAVLTGAVIVGFVLSLPEPQAPPPCFTGPLAGELGAESLWIGADVTVPNARVMGVDVRYEYLVGTAPDPVPADCVDYPDPRWWGCWQYAPDPPGQFVPTFVAETHDVGAIPMLTWYVWLDRAGTREGTPEVLALAESEAVAGYFHDLDVFLDGLSETGPEPVLVQLEPDLWGFLQVHASDPTTIPVALPESCGELPHDATGLSRCLIRTIRDRAPHARIALHASHWAAGFDALHDPDPGPDRSAHAAETAAYLLALGADETDFVAVEMSDRDAGFDNRGWPMEGTGPRTFDNALRWAQALSGELSLPYLWWQVPAGHPEGDNTPGNYADNRVRWVLSHPERVADAGALGVVFGPGEADMTDPNSDISRFRAAMDVYRMRDPVPLCDPGLPR